MRIVHHPSSIGHGRLSAISRPSRLSVLASAVKPNIARTVVSHIATPQSIATAAAIYVASAAPALADGSPFEGVQANSLYVTGGLVLMCIPGELNSAESPDSSVTAGVVRRHGDSEPVICAMWVKVASTLAYHAA